MAKDNSKGVFKEWLEKLQQESWQLELLISGLALFGIYESRSWIDNFRHYSNTNFSGSIDTMAGFLNGILAVGWNIFFINLLIHVILRGLWIGAIGLRYVSEDIDYDGLNYSPRFTSLLRKRVGEFDDFIEKLERICSVLFAYTFLLFLLFVSAMLFFAQTILLFELGSKFVTPSNPAGMLFGLMYFFIGLIVFFDFITMGIFKKIDEPSISKIYSYIFLFYSWTTLSVFYSPILYNFLDNKYTKRLFYLSVPYIILITSASNIFTNNNFSFFPPSDLSSKSGELIKNYNYDDLRQVYFSQTINESKVFMLPLVTLNKFMNDEKYLQIFLKMRPRDIEKIKAKSGREPYYKSGMTFTMFSSSRKKDDFYSSESKSKISALKDIRVERRQLRRSKKNVKDEALLQKIDAQLDSLNVIINKKDKEYDDNISAQEQKKLTDVKKGFLDLFELEIDHRDIKDDLNCFFYSHPYADDKGLLCIYPTDSLSYGQHEFYYYKNDTRINPVNKDVINKYYEHTLPFYQIENRK